MTKKLDTPRYTRKNLAHYDADFYNWTIDQDFNERDLYIQDTDAVIRDRKGNLMFVEIKRRNYEPKPYQKRNMKIINAIMKAGIAALEGNIEITIDGKRENHNVTYHGYKLLQLSGDSFYSSDFTLNGRQVSSDQLADTIGFGNYNSSATGAIDYEY